VGTAWPDAAVLHAAEPAATAAAAVGDEPTGPRRRCIVTGQVEPKQRLVRFVVAPDAAVVADVAGRLPGRGLWVTADRAVLADAVRRQAFRRAARQAVAVPDDLPAQVARLVLARCLDLLGLARRAGRAVFGFERVRERLLAGDVGLLLAAYDGDARDRGRLRPLAGRLPVVEILSADEIGQATGRARTVHGAVAAGRFAEAILHESGRLAGLRPMAPADDRPGPTVQTPSGGHDR
jgi:predicted RNA-binding protein YlxR (DUF448 family)